MECSTTNISDLPEIQLNNTCQRGTQKMREGQVVLETNEMAPPLPPQLSPEQMEQLTQQIQSISSN